MRIVHVANFYGPRSGGLRTAMHAIAAEYARRGHEPVLVVPGATHEDTTRGGIRRISVPAPVVPGSGGYRLITEVARVRRLLDELRPDRLEVSDRTTLAPLGGFARSRGIPAIVFAHERVDRLLQRYVPINWRIVADAANRRLAADFDAIVATTDFAGEEFRRIGARQLVRAPLGVDLTTFHPDRFDPWRRARLVEDAEVLIVHCGRLSPEKRPERSVDALRMLRSRGVDARLVIVGSGASHSAVRRRAAGQPVTMLGFVPQRIQVARILAAAHVVIAPGPMETFGLAALEALACGTPVVASRSGALGEVIGDAGVVVADDAAHFATGIEQLLSTRTIDLETTARAQAEQYPWSRTADVLLSLHARLGAGDPAQGMRAA